MLLTPTTSNVMDRLPGVNATSKREAEKLLLAMHGFSEVDVRMRSAHASGDSASSSVEIKDAIESFMVAVDGSAFQCPVDGMLRRAPASTRESVVSARVARWVRVVGQAVVVGFTAGAERGCWVGKASDCGNYGKAHSTAGWLEGR